MRSVVNVSQINSRDGIRMEEVIPKSEPNPEGSSSSSVSTPEPDGETVIQDAAQRQKRKGGRKPIYATSEERKQRNRQAQAAFRERRTEYIKQLETTIKHNEETLQSLQQSHRSAADECLMLRYKNSLLERILLEKGIDVQAELRMKSGSPDVPPAKPARQPISQNSPLSRTAINRQSVNRHKVGMPQKLDHSNISQAHREDSYTLRSPQLHPTPISHGSSPSTAKSPGFSLQGGMSPSGTEMHPQQQQNIPQLHQRQRPPLLSPIGGYNGNGNEQEYDAQADMLDEQQPDPDGSGEGASYTPDYHEPRPLSARAQPQTQTQLSEQRIAAAATAATHVATTTVDMPTREETEAFVRGDSFFDHFDPMLDADPFGLTASMHFQTPFSYTQSHARP
ncbi:hypothetical protein RJZ90_000201 [Blastomyces dermatitidis]